MIPTDIFVSFHLQGPAGPAGPQGPAGPAVTIATTPGVADTSAGTAGSTGQVSDGGHSHPYPTTVGSATSVLVQQGGYRGGSTVPGAYPYTTLDTDSIIKVDTSAARTIVLADGTTEIEQVLVDVKDLAGTNAITVGVASGRKLNGQLNGAVTISANGAMRGYMRTTDGNWHGGV